MIVTMETETSLGRGRGTGAKIAAEAASGEKGRGTAIDATGATATGRGSGIDGAGTGRGSGGMIGVVGGDTIETTAAVKNPSRGTKGETAGPSRGIADQATEATSRRRERLMSPSPRS